MMTRTVDLKRVYTAVHVRYIDA
eukprot:SAG31_NODE_5125_length_2727_cov_1.282725_4_plen_22_part_01